MHNQDDQEKDLETMQRGVLVHVRDASRHSIGTEARGDIRAQHSSYNSLGAQAKVVVCGYES